MTTAIKGAVRAVVRRLYRIPSPTYNHASHRNLRRFGAELSPVVRRTGTPILNVGGGGRAFPTNTVDCFVREVVVNIDVEPHPGVHCIADAARLPFASEVFAGVLSTAVLEHVHEQGGIGGYVHPFGLSHRCLLYTSPSPRDGLLSRMPSSA